MSNAKITYQSLMENSSCLRKRQMLAFIKGKLSTEEMRAVEFHLVDCALCLDAIEGIKTLEGDKDEFIMNIPTPVIPKNTKVIRPEPSRNIAIKQSIIKRSDKIKRRIQLTSSFGFILLLLLGAFVIYKYEYLPKKEAQQQSFIPKEFTNDNETILINNEEIIEDNSSNKTIKTPIETEEIIPIIIDQDDEESNSEHEEEIIALDSQNVSKETVVKEEASLPKESLTVASAPIKENAKDLIDTNSFEELEEVKISFKDNIQSREKSWDPDFRKGMIAFENKNYGTALLYFKSIAQNRRHPQYADALYYASLSAKSLNRKEESQQFNESLRATSKAEEFDLEGID